MGQFAAEKSAMPFLFLPRGNERGSLPSSSLPYGQVHDLIISRQLYMHVKKFIMIGLWIVKKS